MNELRIIDRIKENSPEDIGYPFALDVLLGRHTGEGGGSVLHIWNHPRAFVIGSKDSRLPRAADAIRWLERQGYSVLVRNSGGAAVPLDLGVVNLSLILPIEATASSGFRDDFELMYALIRDTAADYGCKAERGEVAGSYCPGDYDLQVDGLKFCGIAQRRQVRAMIIQAFVIVEGSGATRAELVKAFYDRAGVGAEPGDYPEVIPGVMTSLQERAVTGLETAEYFAAAIARKLRGRQSAAASNGEVQSFVMPDREAIESACAALRLRYPLPR
jgi:octanoyl-[GcvH]:protein N-octanoyltransferase